MGAEQMEKQVIFPLSRYLARKRSRNLGSSHRHWEVKGQKRLFFSRRKALKISGDCMQRASRKEKIGDIQR